MSDSYKIIWFKKDLRIIDHEPLIKGTQYSNCILIYIFEPKLWQEPDYSYFHYSFLKECLNELKLSLESYGYQLIIKIGNVVEVLSQINEQFPIDTIYSHQETGNYWTFQRDIEVQKWCNYNRVDWCQFPQFGVIRRLKSRDGWSNQWMQFFSKPLEINLHYSQIKSNFKVLSQQLDELDQFVKKPANIINLQPGGTTHGLTLLNSFLSNRGEKYYKELSSPVTAFDSCSRLSAHITFGSLSMRYIYKQALKYKKDLTIDSKTKKSSWNSSLTAFMSRLRWHCHFIQKLEDDPSIEFKSLHPHYDYLIKNDNDELFEKWKNGLTGFPLIDACMQALQKTGWLNFRMRAMVTSFACHHLWLPWQNVACHLANFFTDYEPGIHYNQIQMQAGSTGINAIRIYNPIKQALDHDPNCIFIKKWLPRLTHLSPETIHLVHENNLFSSNYITPIINEKNARKYAAKQLFSLKKNPNFKKLSEKIYLQHGSRKSIINKK